MLGNLVKWRMWNVFSVVHLALLCLVLLFVPISCRFLSSLSRFCVTSRTSMKVGYSSSRNLVVLIGKCSCGVTDYYCCYCTIITDKLTLKRVSLQILVVVYLMFVVWPVFRFPNLSGSWDCEVQEEAHCRGTPWACVFLAVHGESFEVRLHVLSRFSSILAVAVRHFDVSKIEASMALMLEKRLQGFLHM